MPKKEAGNTSPINPVGFDDAGNLIGMQAPRKPKVFFALPLHDGRCEATTANTLIHALANSPDRSTELDTWCWFNSSAICLNFNSLWAKFYKRWKDGLADVFVMLHSDIEVTGHPYEDQGRPWVDFLVDKALSEGMACLSVVNAIKNRQGDTSVAMGHGEWSQKRLSFADLDKLPATFDDADFGRATGTTLLVNTGLMVLVPHDSWAGEFQFVFNDRIVITQDGERVAQMAPEDWNMSRFFHARNMCYGATREIETMHYGKIGFPNYDDGSGLYTTGKTPEDAYGEDDESETCESESYEPEEGAGVACIEDNEADVCESQRTAPASASMQMQMQIKRTPAIRRIK